MPNRSIYAEITRKASKTFYAATNLFPKNLREDIFILYSFVRTADDLIDSNPPKIDEYNRYKKNSFDSLQGIDMRDPLITAFTDLVRRKNLDKKLIADFFHSQELDFKTHTYATHRDLKKFIYGVAEVIGLFMAQLMELPKDAYASAQDLGYAMQLINILRDIIEDHSLGRLYIPLEDLRQFHLSPPLNRENIIANKKNFIKLMRYEIDIVRSYLRKAKKGYKYIPKRYLFGIKTAADLYSSTADSLYKNPFQILKKKSETISDQHTQNYYYKLFPVSFWQS